MTLTIDLTPQMERRLHELAAERGLKVGDYLLCLLERELPFTHMSARAMLRLPPDERGRLLAAAAEQAAPMYDVDLARPAAERELTAFTALDGEDFHDGDA